MTHEKKINRDFETIDNEIKKGVQAVELDIPRDVEERFMEALERVSATPGPPRREKKNLIYMGALATAASILLAAFLLVPALFRQTPVTMDTKTTAEELEVFVDYARVEGMPANTYIINQQEMTIVWFEKAPLMAKNEKRN